MKTSRLVNTILVSLLLIADILQSSYFPFTEVALSAQALPTQAPANPPPVSTSLSNSVQLSQTQTTPFYLPLIVNPSTAVDPNAGRLDDFATSSQWKTYRDPLYQYQLAIPAEWYVLPTPAQAIYGAAVFFNYDPDAIKTDSDLPSDWLKIQIGVAPLANGQSFQDWVNRWRGFQTNSALTRDLNFTASSIEPAQIGAFEAATYKLQAPQSSSVQEVDIKLDDKQVMIVGISSADSKALPQVYKILSELKTDPSAIFSDEVLNRAEEWAHTTLSPILEQVNTATVTGTCPVNQTYSGAEAPNSPISLDMPFRSGETWTVGGSGSFYGNNQHCNVLNDYYATDWNRDGDNGAAVLPVADGTISDFKVPTCPTSSYGCFVQIDHAATGIRTLYGHLSGVNKTSGFVIHTEQIGTVGSTGNSEQPHLHLTFRKSDDAGNYYSHCYNNGKPCPNGEASLTPQSPKPSPINTTSGFLPLVDGNSYTSANGGISSPVDVYLLVDLTSSFADDLPLFKTQAPQIINTLKASNSDIRFGLGKFEDYPISPFGSAASGDKAYERLIDLTANSNQVINAINGLFTRYGDDYPESQLAALYQAATGAGQNLSGVGFPNASIPAGQQANFRTGAVKLFLLWTDAPFHLPGDPGVIPYPGPSFNDTVNAILALDPPKVIGISSGGGGTADLARIATATDALAPTGGIDCDANGSVDISAGQPLVCGIAATGVGIGNAVTALVDAATNLPIADAGGPYRGAVNQSITFNGIASFDPDGTIVRYEWDFESNGVFDVRSANPTATHAYPSAFSGTVTLRVTDNSGNTATDTTPVQVTTSSGPSVLDNFNRPNGALGPNWFGKQGIKGYQIVNQLLDVGKGGPVYWSPAVFGSDQEAGIKLSTIDAKGARHGVLLKVQGQWNKGAILVAYNTKVRQLNIRTYIPGMGWTNLATIDKVVLQNGDVLSASVAANGTTRAFVNGVERAVANVGPFFAGKGGRIGLWFNQSTNAVVDDFSGGGLQIVSAGAESEDTVDETLNDEGLEALEAAEISEDEIKQIFLPLIKN